MALPPPLLIPPHQDFIYALMLWPGDDEIRPVTEPESSPVSSAYYYWFEPPLPAKWITFQEEATTNMTIFKFGFELSKEDSLRYCEGSASLKKKKNLAPW